jgi:predicted aspartyl protease
VVIGALVLVLSNTLVLAVSTDTKPDALVEADALYRSGHFAEAEKAYAQVVAADSGNGRAALRLGELALLGNRFDQAERRLKEALELGVDDRQAKSFLAECYYRQDRFAEAAPLYRQIDRAAVADQLESLSSVTPYEVAGDARVTRVTFEQTDPLPIVKARINGGEEVHLLIDTGAAELMLDAKFVERIGARQFDPPTMATFAGGRQMPVHHGTIESIQLGDFTIKNVPVAIKEARRGPFAKRVQGIIGTVLLYHFYSTLDYPAGELVLRRRTPEMRAALDAEVADSKRTYAVPFWMAKKHSLVAWGTVNDTASCLMHVDTGMAGGGFDCHESVRKEAGIDLTGQPTFQGMGGGGPVEVTPYTIDRIALGEARQSGIQALFGAMPPSMEYAMGFRIGALVSHGFFRPYALTLDFERMQMHLRPGR